MREEMTREEAIALLQGRICLIDKYYPQIEDYREALVLAIKALEQKQTDAKINVGDEVYVNDDCKAIVIGISTLEGWAEPYNILFENGNTDWVIRSAITKTGKHYDAIEEVLKELRGDEE